MIPIKLTIQGLYSYQEKQTIDFTKLTGANLFGIFGSVGSGKSTILEAITFAIYGKTDRLNLSGDNRNYNMMNLKSNELFIEFDFETGKEQTGYKVVVRGKRNGKKFEEVKTLDRTAYKSDSGSWIPIAPEALEKAVGLSYDNFKRTIIIPQGQFQEFLQLGNKDRTQMMKELFNLEKYELYYKVTSLEFKNNAKKQHVEGQLQQLGVANVDMVKAHEEKICKVTEEIAQLSKTRIDSQKKEAELDKLQQLFKKMLETQGKLQQQKELEPVFNKLEATIIRYEQCSNQFKSIIHSLTVSDHRLQQNTLQIEKEAAGLKKSDDEIQACEAVYGELKTAYDTRELLKQRADELAKMARMNVLSATVLTEESRLVKGRMVLDDTVAKVDKMKGEKESLEVILNAEKAKLPDLTMLSKVKTWHVENKNLLQQLENLKTDRQKYGKETKRIHEALASWYRDTVFVGLPEGASVTDAIQFLRNHVDQRKIQLSTLSHDVAHFRVQAKLEEYAVNLKDGEACPLCGSLQHPVVFSPASLADTIEKTLKAEEFIEKQLAGANEMILQLTDLSNQHKFNFLQVKDLEDKLKLHETKLSAHQDAFQWEDYRDESMVSKAFLLAETLQKEVRQKEENLSALVKQWEREMQNKEKFQKEIEKIQTALTISQTEIKTLLEQINLINVGEYRSKHPLEIESERSVLTQKYASIEKQFDELTAQLNQLRKVKDTVSGSLEAHKKEFLQEQEINTSLQKEFARLLKKAEFENIEEVKSILSQDFNLDLEKKKLDEFRQQMALLQSQSKQFLIEIDHRNYDEEEHRKIRAAVNTLTDSLNDKNQELGRAVESLRKLKSDLESKALLLKKLEELEVRADNIRVMKSLFKGSGFVNFISSVYLQNLCNAANERFFQLTRQKLSLEITDDNCFQVRDFMNGGKLRSVKTLSGGQIFQAALSLALSLADNIQKITDSNQNFFFLDEGFGSLDKDSLSVVFDSLKSLRKENRIVGVISHVEEMQQEIDTHLRVENNEETGSRILTSWS